VSVNTGISTSLRQPKTFHVFTYQQGGRSLVPLPQRLLLIGTQKGGTGVAGTIYPVDDAVTAEAQFGVGTQLTLMVRKAIETEGFIGAGPFLFACPVAEPGGGVQHTQTFTFGGAATTGGPGVFRIAGRTLNVSIAVGDSVTTMASALNVAINAQKQFLPVTSTSAIGVTTATHVVKGVGGQDVIYEVVSLPPGVTCVTAQGVAGTGVSDETAALANAAGPDYDAIALENHASGDITLALSHVTAAWAPGEKKWRWVLFGEPGSIGTAATLSSASNDRAISVIVCEQTPSLPGEMAAALGVALLSKTRPNGNWDGMKVPLYPPYDAFDFTATEVETALAAGLTPLKAVVDPQTRVQQAGVCKIEKFVTTCTTQNGQPFEALRDIAVPRTGAFIARQIDAAFAAKFGSQANPDGVLADDDVVPRIRDMVSSILYTMQGNKILTNVAADLQQLVVELDVNAPGRVNVDVAYTVVLGLHQVAFVHRVKI
jgi:phage tail sheath gpL-like